MPQAALTPWSGAPGLAVGEETCVRARRMPPAEGDAIGADAPVHEVAIERERMTQ